MTAIDDRPKLDETYARATRSSDLSASSEHRTDADILLAAGYAAQKNRNGMVALMAYRMKVTGDRASKVEIVEALIDHMGYEVKRRRTLPMINRPNARMVVQTVINWWSSDNCEVCTGRLMERHTSRRSGARHVKEPANVTSRRSATDSSGTPRGWPRSWTTC
jgi:hypothetical protein